MTTLSEIAKKLVSPGKGILAVDDFRPGITKRFEKHGIASTAETRRDYREMLFTSSAITNYISGVILYDETFHQSARNGQSIPDLIKSTRALVGIKLDLGQQPLANTNGELITIGLDDLRTRIADYKAQGASFAKWRAVLSISASLPTHNAIHANAHTLARYAAICQAEGLVPIVEPDILMSGDHTINRCADITAQVLEMQFEELAIAGVDLAAMILKPNMITAGSTCPSKPTSADVADATLDVLRRHVPTEVAGIAFLSGGQSSADATTHLRLMNQSQNPWPLTFSYNRALQDDALRIWAGRDENIPAAQVAFTHQAKCNSLASLGRST
jgi:fructose-bisphosphate aldolase, class I